MDFLKKLSINEDNDNTPQGHGHGSAPAHDQQHHGHGSGQDLLKNLGDVLGGNNHSDRRTSESASTPAHRNDNILDKVSDVLGGGQHHQQSTHAPAQHKEENIIDKLSNAFGHSTPSPPPPPKHDGLLGKLEEVVGHVTKNDEPAKPKTFGDKINNVLGGGSRGEEKEDAVDKVIDFVQEHVLKEGQQKDETAIEQLKDKQIADVLRHGIKNATGHDVPSFGGNKKH